MSLFAAEVADTIELAADYEGASQACNEALSTLHWEVSKREEGHLSAFQNPAGLHKRIQPSRVEVGIAAWSLNETVVTIAISAPGIGPAPARRARLQSEALAGQIRKLAEPDDPGIDPY